MAGRIKGITVEIGGDRTHHGARRPLHRWIQIRNRD